MLRGTGVSEGCGIGKALIIQHRSLDYSGVVFGGAQQEKERLRAAINAFMQKTEQLRDRLQASAGERLMGCATNLSPCFPAWTTS